LILIFIFILFFPIGSGHRWTIVGSRANPRFHLELPFPSKEPTLSSTEVSKVTYGEGHELCFTKRQLLYGVRTLSVKLFVECAEPE
jgi:hypothetical protein